MMSLEYYLNKDKIPRVVHTSWKDKGVVDSTSPLILNGIKNLIDLNPDWQVIVHDDKDIDNYLKNKLTPSDYSIIKDISIVEKTDIWRLIKLFNEGGMYVDIDRFCNKKLSEIIKPDVKWVLPVCDYHDFSHDLMISAPFNPVFGLAYNMVLARRKQGIKNVYFLGAQTYMHAILKSMLNIDVTTIPDKFEMMRICDRLNTIPFIQLHVEKLPYNTFLFDFDPSTFKYGEDKSSDWQQLKEKLYHSYGVKHWTGEW